MPSQSSLLNRLSLNSSSRPNGPQGLPTWTEYSRLPARPEIISLAGGLPAPELFPIDEYRQAFEWVLETNGSAALQYGPSEGYLPLREFLAERMTRLGIPAETGQVLITNGSQQGLDLGRSYAYGDSPGDVGLLGAVGHPLVVNPIRGMASVARRRGWPVVQWK